MKAVDADVPRTRRGSLYNQLFTECQAMARYALASGIKVPGKMVCALEVDEAAADFGEASTSVGKLEYLVRVHVHLADLIAPAKPRTILLMDRQEQDKKFYSFLGPVPLIRSLMLAAICFLALLVCVSLSEHVDGQVNWTKERGFALFLEELFLLSAAGLGATFSALFQANSYVVKGTFDPKYNTTYWTRIVLGLVAGMILAMLIPIDMQPGDSLAELAKPTLAMLGGFSVTVVYTILSRLINTIESLVRGDSKDVVEEQTQLARRRTEEEVARNRLEVSTRLIDLRQQLLTGADPQELDKEMTKIINELMSDELERGIEEEKAPKLDDSSA